VCLLSDKMKLSAIIPYYYGVEGNWSFVLKEKSSS